MIWAVVLAAGESRRMGTQKLLLPFGDATVVEAVVRAALGSRVDRAMVVLGADAREVRAKLAPSGADFTVNEDHGRGMLSSVQAGFAALGEGAEAAVVMLGDQPFLPSAVVDAVIAAYRTSGKGIGPRPIPPGHLPCPPFDTPARPQALQIADCRLQIDDYSSSHVHP